MTLLITVQSIYKAIIYLELTRCINTYFQYPKVQIVPLQEQKFDSLAIALEQYSQQITEVGLYTG